MKRSRINAALREMERMAGACRFALPPFCGYTPEQWQTLGHEYDEIRDCMLGWDITDYGLDDFDRIGFSLVTIRNGNRKTPDAPVDFLIFHNYDEGEIGIWISALYDEDADQFNKSAFDVSAEFTLWDEEGELNVITPKTKPISLKNDGMFFFNYVDWQNGEPLTVEADLDGDEKYETNRVLK